MKLGIATFLYNDKPLDEVAEYVSGLGYEAIEVGVWPGSRHFDLDACLTDKSYVQSFRELLNRNNLTLSALNNALAGQLVLGPHGKATDAWSPSSDPAEKVKFGIEQMKKTAQAASELEIPVVTGFVGSHVWEKWYIFPPEYEQEYEQGWELFAERWNDILDTFKTYGVRFACEVHPTEIAYNSETAERAIAALDGRPEFGFNFDPSHLVWQLIDPVIFIKTFKDRIYHAHAKDGELQLDEVARSGVIPTGDWRRPNRGFRFRTPGWGDVNWRRVITALAEIGYDDVLSYEHEDPIMSREDGCEKAIAFLRPLIIKKRLETVWW
ncbi:sugar phosphate isomerase/epimerase [soil metagenome]